MENCSFSVKYIINFFFFLMDILFFDILATEYYYNYFLFDSINFIRISHNIY